jgi:pentatricopeptide repeat protein
LPLSIYHRKKMQAPSKRSLQQEGDAPQNKLTQPYPRGSTQNRSADEVLSYRGRRSESSYRHQKKRSSQSPGEGARYSNYTHLQAQKDYAQQLQTFAKNRQVTTAEEFYQSIPSAILNKYHYHAMLNAYAMCGESDKAQSFFNTIPQLYRNEYAWAILLKAHVTARDLKGAKACFADLCKEITPNITTWNTLLNAYATAGDVEGAENCFARLRKEVKPNITTWSTLLNAYVTAGDVKGAEACFANLCGKIKPNITTWSTLLNVYVTAGDLKGAEACFADLCEEITPNLKTWTTLLNAYVAAGDVKDAEACFADLCEKITPDITTWGALLNAYVTAGDVKGAEACFADLCEKITPNIATWNTLLNAYVTDGDVKGAEACFADLCEKITPDITTWSTLLNAYVTAGDVMGAEACFADLCKEITPNITTWNTLLNAYATTGDVKGAEACLTALRKEMKPDIATWNTLLNAYATTGDVKGAEDCFANLCRKITPNIRTWSTLLNAYVTAGDIKGAAACFVDLCKEITPDIKAWSTLLNAYVTAGDVKGAEACFVDLCKEITPDIKAWSTLLNAYVTAGDVKGAEVRFACLCKEITPNITAWSTLLNAYATTGDVKGAEACFARLHKEVKPDISTWSTLFNAYVTAGDVKGAEDCFADLCRKIKPNITTWSTFLNAYATTGDVKGAEACFAALCKEITPNLPTWNTLLNAYATTGDVKGAEARFADLCKEKTPNITTWNTLLNAYVTAGDVKGAEDCFADLCKEIKPDIKAWSTFLNAYATTGDVKGAKACFARLHKEVKPDISTWSTLLNAYATTGDVKGAEACFADLCRKIKPNITAWSTFLNAYVTAGDVKGAEACFADLCKEITPNLPTWNTLLNAYATAGDVKGVEACFADLCKEITPDIKAWSTLLNAYATVGDVKGAEACFADLCKETTPDIKAWNTLLNAYATAGDFEGTERCFQQIPQALQTTVTWNIRLKACEKTANPINRAQALFATIPEDRQNVRTHLAISKILSRYFSLKDIVLITACLGKLNHALETPSGTLVDRRLWLRKAAQYWHQISLSFHRKYQRHRQKRQESTNQDYVQLLESINHAVAGYVQQLQQLLENPSLRHVPPTLLETWLINRYIVGANFIPPYQKRSPEEIETIKQRANENLTHALVPLTTEAITFVEVNRRGQKIGQYQNNDPLYHLLSAGYCQNPVIVKSGKQTSPKNIPLFIHYENDIRITTALGGSKPKDGDFIAITLRDADFWNPLFPSVESTHYSQRALLPGNSELNNKGLTGTFQIKGIPATFQYKIAEQLPFIAWDGCGFMPQSLAETAGIVFPEAKIETSASYLTTQATQYYSSQVHPDVVPEWFNRMNPTMQQILEEMQNGEWNAKEISEQAKAFSSKMLGSLPKHNLLGIPVAGGNIVLPAKHPIAREAVRTGLIYGRNPYSSPLLKVAEPEGIDYWGDFSAWYAAQYTLIGYEQRDGKLERKFWKGILIIVPDIYWKEEKTHLIVNLDDQKSSEGWHSEEAKKSEQKGADIREYLINGGLLIKQVFSLMNAIGLPRKRASEVGGDFDGDLYDAIAIQELINTKRMIQIENQQNAFINLKCPKTFTLRVNENIGNFQHAQIYASKILEKWSTIGTIFMALTANDAATVAKKLYPKHCLADLLGKDWQLQVKDNPIAVIKAEIAVSIKCGEDGFKTQVPVDILQERATAYLKQLRHYILNLSVAYGKKSKEKIETAFKEAEKTQHMAPLKSAIQALLSTYESENLNGNFSRAMAHSFFAKVNGKQPAQSAEAANDLTSENYGRSFMRMDGRVLGKNSLEEETSFAQQRPAKRHRRN